MTTNTRDPQLDAILSGQSTEFQRKDRKYSRDRKTLGFEVGTKSIMEQEQEVRALQRALNLPQAPSLPTSLTRPDMSASSTSFLSSSTRQTRVITETDLKTKTDALYTYNLEAPLHNSLSHPTQSYLNRLEGAPLTASSIAQAPGGVNTDPGSHGKCSSRDHYYHPSSASEGQLSELSGQHSLWNPRKTTVTSHCYGNDLYNTNLSRDHLSQSCVGSGGVSLLDKVKEAHLVIENQNSMIAKAGNEISSLQRELKKMILDKEMCEDEIQTLRQERQTFDVIKSEGIKKRQELLARLNQLDQVFKELSLSHNSLLVKSKKKEVDLLQTELRLNALEDSNKSLQQENDRLVNDQKLAKQQINQLLSVQKGLQTEKQHVKGETAMVIQENKRLADENAMLRTRCGELLAQLRQQQTSYGKAVQSLEDLKMAYESKCNRVDLLEEEVKQQQETFNLLHKEQEQAMKKSTEQQLLYLNKESTYLDEIRRLKESKDFLKKRCQELLQKNIQLDKNSVDTGCVECLSSVNVKSVSSVEKHPVSSLNRQMDQLLIENSNLVLKLHDVESLKDELSHSHKEQSRLAEQLELLHEEHARALNENKNLEKQLNYSQKVQAQLEKGIQDLSNSNEVLYSEVINLKENERRSQSIAELQENLKQIKRKIISLEAEKCDLMASLQEFQKDRDSWNEEKKELMLSLAELDAENSEMRKQLTDVNNQASSEVSLSEEFQAIKQELDKVHKMLRLKDEELESQSVELHDKQNQLNRLNEEHGHLKKSFAEIASKTSARNLVISTIRDQLEEQSQRITELERELTSKTHQFEELNARHSKLELELCQSNPMAMKWINSERNKLEEERDLLKIKVFELKFRLNESKNFFTDEIAFDSTDTDLSVRRKSDGCLTRRIASHSAVRHGVLSKNDDTLHALKQENSDLRARLDELVVERNSVLQDSEDLMEGMQQLKEAFEDEIERRLEKQRLECQNLSSKTTNSSSQETQNEVLSDEPHLENKKSLEMKCRNMGIERDELRRQVDELRKSRATSDESLEGSPKSFIPQSG